MTDRELYTSDEEEEERTIPDHVWNTMLEVHRFADLMHQIAVEHGFPNVDTVPEDQKADMFLSKTMLIVTELGEMCQVMRKQGFEALELREEMADVFIRLFDLVAACGMTEAMHPDLVLTSEDHAILHKLSMPLTTTFTLEDFLC